MYTKCPLYLFINSLLSRHLEISNILNYITFSEDVPAFLRYYREYKNLNPEKFLPSSIVEESSQVINPVNRVADILSSIIPSKKT